MLQRQRGEAGDRVRPVLRVGEVAALRVADITMNDRSGSVRIRHGKGLKAREVPLNATVRRALRQHLDRRQAPGKDAALFVSSRETAMPVRTISGPRPDPRKSG